MNKNFQNTYKTSCENFKDEHNELLRAATEIFNPDILIILTNHVEVITSFHKKHDMIMCNGKQLDNFFEMNRMVSVYFEDIFKNMHDCEQHFIKLNLKCVIYNPCNKVFHKFAVFKISVIYYSV